MANLFDSITVDETIEIQEQRVAGSGQQIKESGVYVAELTMARFAESKGGASSLVLSFVTEAEQKLTRTVWFTNKNGETFWEKNGRKGNLPGFNELSRLSELLAGNAKAFGNLEDKIVPVYDREKGEEVPTESKVAIELIGKPVTICVRKTLEDKTALNQASGKYEPNGETRIVMEIEGYVDPVDGKTAAEKLGNKDASFIEKFKTAVEKSPENDKRKVAKGESTEQKTQAPSEAAQSAFA